MLRIISCPAISVAAMLAAATLVDGAGAHAQEVITLPPGATVVGSTPIVAPIVAAPATTVQLPTFNFFTISTSVMVPDRGTASLGGVSYGGMGTRSSGVPGLGAAPSFGNRAGGRFYGGGSMSVSVQVHDLAAMDEALRADGKPAEDRAAFEAWAARVERAKQSTAGRPTISVAEARRLRDGGAAQPR